MAIAAAEGRRTEPIRRMTLPNRAIGGPHPGDADSGATPHLEREEELVASLRGIGSTMFLTTDRVIVARDGVERRPRSGIQSFPLDTVRLIRIERGNGPSGRVVVSTATGQEAVSMFFEARSAERAEDLVAKSRLLTARRRRGSGPARTSTEQSADENRGRRRDP
jgi:hypothetical protein